MNNIDKQLQNILDKFKEEIKVAQNQALDSIYCDLIPEYYENDLIANMREKTLQDLISSDNRRGYVWKDIRKKILEENKEEITNEIISDLLEENKKLKKELEGLYNEQY